MSSWCGAMRPFGCRISATSRNPVSTFLPRGRPGPPPLCGACCKNTRQKGIRAGLEPTFFRDWRGVFPVSNFFETFLDDPKLVDRIAARAADLNRRLKFVQPSLVDPIGIEPTTVSLQGSLAPEEHASPNGRKASHLSRTFLARPRLSRRSA